MASLWRHNPRQDLRGHLLDVPERPGERFGFAAMGLHVVTRCGVGLETDGLADNEGDRFGFGFPDGLSRLPKAFGEVQSRVHQFMRKHAVRPAQQQVYPSKLNFVPPG
jgi:hypothetical protein